MRHLRATTAVFVATLALAACTKADTNASPGATVANGFPLSVVKDVPLPGGATRLDYQDVDPTTHRLYVAHLGDGTVHVIDLDQLTVVTTINDISSAHGVRLDPDDHRLYASATGTNEVVGVDANTDQIVSRTPAGQYPDGIAFDPKERKLYVSNEHDTTETVIDAGTGQRSNSITIGGAAGNSAYDSKTGNILINVQDKGHIAIVDPTNDTVTRTIDTPDCDSNHGLYIDADNRIAFVACEGNAKLLVIDLDTKVVTTTIDVGDSPDVLAFDYGLHRLYVASESGTVTVVDEDGTSARKIAEAKVADTAHSVAVDPASHRVFFPLENVDGHPALRVMQALN
jgi:YVTN family beta-propeller protein